MRKWGGLMSMCILCALDACISMATTINNAPTLTTTGQKTENAQSRNFHFMPEMTDTPNKKIYFLLPGYNLNDTCLIYL